ncbi:hypothetical protein ABBQ32_003031 [Trebouxia sp. C0010 RCD-2024]
MATLGTITQLPKEFFLSAATLAGDGNQKQDLAEQPAAIIGDQQPEQAAANETRDSADSQAGESGPTCVTCGIGVSSPSFESQTEQRLHFKSDRHRFNVKLRSVGKAAVDEAEFERLVSEKDEVSSISGSDTDSDDEPSTGRAATQKSSQLMFKSQGGKLFAIWRPVIISEQDSRSLPDVELLHRLVAVTDSAQCWAVILSKGGHFSAAVFDLRPVPPFQHSKANAPLFRELAHKSYHRYVVRAKAGGRQSSKDATGKSIKSAGAQIRRYNEAALEKEIKDTLSDWKQLLSRADRIFVQASVSNARPIFGGEGAALARSDPRVRSIPFNTRRPTFSETKRVLHSLLSVFEPSSHALQALSAPAKPAVPKPPKHSPQKAAAAAAPEPEPQPVKEPGPPLHEAAKAGDADKVKRLLDEGADPCQADGRGKVPYDVAADKAVRDAFRRFMASEPDKWDYTLAGVPSPLTDEMESLQMQKQAEKKAKQREKEKERKRAAAEKKAKAAEGARAAAEAEVTTAAAEAAALAARSKQGKASKPAALSRSEQEMSKKREQMAAAAESRMARLKLASQQQQLWS